MKRISLRVLAICLVLVFARSAFAAPLVFKTTKELKNDNEKEYAELITFDASKYRQIRIGVKLEGAASDKLNILGLEAIEGEDAIFIPGVLSVDKSNRSKSITIDCPPAKLKISAQLSGTYKIFIWAL